jgi:predicted dienelactone hydrolase
MKLIAACALAWLALAPTRVLAADAGFQEVQVANPGDQPITVGVWYPTTEPAHEQRFGIQTQVVAPPGARMTGERLPLLVMSHGTGGFYGSHYDTALALARAGFVVAALTHPGDNYMDKSRAGQVRRRPPQLERVLDYMLTEWPDHARIDPERVGAFGFSAGGFTVLAAIGGAPDFSKIRPHCEAHPDYFECTLNKRAAIAPPPAAGASDATSFRDPRIKTAVIAAPALGYTFDREGLDPVTIPIQLWSAEFDHILPAPDYADSVRANLPRPPEFHLVAKADHFDFLAPCSAELAKIAPDICQSLSGFDRGEFHERFNAEVVRFFRETLQ